VNHTSCKERRRIHAERVQKLRTAACIGKSCEAYTPAGQGLDRRRLKALPQLLNPRETHVVRRIMAMSMRSIGATNPLA